MTREKGVIGAIVPPFSRNAPQDIRQKHPELAFATSHQTVFLHEILTEGGEKVLMGGNTVRRGTTLTPRPMSRRLFVPTREPLPVDQRITSFPVLKNEA